MEGYAHLFDHGFFFVLDENLFANNLRFFPFALKFILVGILWVELLNIKVFYVGDSIGDAPRDMVVMADDNAGCAGETDPYYIDIARDKVAFVPDGRRGLPQVRIVAEDGRAGHGHGASNNPVVAGSEHSEATQLLQLLVLFQYAEIHALILDSGRNN